MKSRYITLTMFASVSILHSCLLKSDDDGIGNETFAPKFRLIPSDTFYFKSFVDCNMAEAWVGDTFRIFPGKYGEDPLWGDGDALKFADGRNADEAFLTPPGGFQTPQKPPIAKTGTPGLHGSVWFETVYQSPEDSTGKTLYAIYQNENYPETLPYDSSTGEGYIDKDWPSGLKGPNSRASTCRIGVMRTVNGGHSWVDLGILLEDLQPRMILKQHNNSVTFAGGVGDPCAVASGEHLYIFFSEYSYPGVYDADTYDRDTERSGQCISVARILLSDLDDPKGKARRWDGKGFNAAHNGIGKPISSLQIPSNEGGGPVTNSTDTNISLLDRMIRRISPAHKRANYGLTAGAFHWGPSVSWNTFLECWVMTMGKVIGPHFQGHQTFISFNPNKDLSQAMNSQAWSKPRLLLEQYGSCLWYPSLQPMNTEEDLKERNSSLKLGKRARLFIKHRYMKRPDNFISTNIVEFDK
jgi:hypothetical protein